MTQPIYLDNNATTGLDPRVLAVMLELLCSPPANPSSTHAFGQRARVYLQAARQAIAHFFNVQPQEIIFTSGGTEGINLLLRSVITPSFSGHVITSDIEHSCIDQTLKILTDKKEGMVTYLPVSLLGAIRPEALEAAIRKDTRLIVLSAVNSETGVKINLEAIAEIALRRGICLIIDGVALMGKELFTLPKGVMAIAFSGHKFHAPQGVGFVIVRSSFPLKPQITGGGQELGRRAGTENLPGIVGLAKAVELLSEELPSASERMGMLRDRLEAGLMETISPLSINGEGLRVVNVSNLAFPKVSGEDLLIALDLAGIAASHGSACSSGALEPSRVLIQMGLSQKRARSSIRFSLSRYTTLEEIDRCIAIITELLKGFKD